MMAAPLSPAPVTDLRPDHLPAYVSNGLIGLRVREVPLRSGLAIVQGLVGEDPIAHVESALYAPYPLAGDLRLERISLLDVLHQARVVDQRYDFTCGELHTRFTLEVDGVEARVEVLTFCSRSQPTLALQETRVQVSRACDLELRAAVDPTRIQGRLLSRATRTPGESQPVVDGTLHWEPLGGLTSCGAAYVAEFLGEDDVTCERAEWDEQGPLRTSFGFRARAGRTYRLRQITALVPSVLNHQPHLQATRMAALGAELGFDALRRENRAAWAELWKGRVCLLGADPRWQALVDAAFFYLHTSVHTSSPASTSIFGLAQWYDYHYYYGHIMWDLEAFSLPPLLFTEPASARALLDYRTRMLEGARANAKLYGHRGLMFPWESSQTRGEEAARGAGTAAAYEHHASLDVAFAFAQYVHATGDERFLRREAWPVLEGVAEWIESRVMRTPRGYEIHRNMGIAERKRPVNNAAYVNMAARTVLREAVWAAERLGYAAPRTWTSIAERLVMPYSADGTFILNHDGYHPTEEKGNTPEALAGLFPLGYEVSREIEQATLRYYLDRVDDYLGAPMLSAICGVWAAWVGDRARSLKLFEEGYAAFVSERFLNTHEYREDRFPEQPVAGPFFANLGGFLMACLYGLPGIRFGPGEPETWCRRPVVMPDGWEGIEVERVWVRGQPARLLAYHGDDRARLELRRNGAA
jgi:trehalose/maltose hydrolase-like predicted phosphorylase